MKTKIHPSLFLVDIVPMFDDKYWIDLGFFHRHPAFQKLFEKISSKKIIKLDNYSKSSV